MGDMAEAINSDTPGKELGDFYNPDDFSTPADRPEVRRPKTFGVRAGLHIGGRGRRVYISLDHEVAFELDFRHGDIVEVKFGDPGPWQQWISLESRSTKSDWTASVSATRGQKDSAVRATFNLAVFEAAAEIRSDETCMAQPVEWRKQRFNGITRLLVKLPDWYARKGATHG